MLFELCISSLCAQLKYIKSTKSLFESVLVKLEKLKINIVFQQQMQGVKSSMMMDDNFGQNRHAC